ncbi:glycoside hydrolase family 16 protein [Myriangium duriaei CBS 260.36]|uniref:Glycoside hydrolase family 16 protein n=1 Tax=Myriangium duriaei CBS 260.36 TaxID=1168546 RepID=A0A9P4J9W6_9PEZI|nr:glycoside hydrolase family 16 protein [Myriangium duriaei CBS 260.36]
MASYTIKLALICLATFSSPTFAAPASPLAKQTTHGWTVTTTGTNTTSLLTFNTLFAIDFSKATSISSIRISDYAVPAGAAPYSHSFCKDNVQFNRGDSLSLLVPGTQAPPGANIPSAEIATPYDDILYGSVRVVAKSSSVPGTCEGFFFYQSDAQETDIEILTHDQQNLWVTNQPTQPAAVTGKVRTTAQLPVGGNSTDGYHEYRTDWLPGQTNFYIDGVLRRVFTQNVADKPSAFVVNNWSNGDPEWSAGPPRETSELRIRSIVGYFNRTSVADGK